MLARALRSRGRAAAGVLALAALAGLGAVRAASGGGPSAPPAPARIEPVRAALFAQCIAGSREIAPRAGRNLRQDRPADRLESGPHAVCAAAILSGPEAGKTDD